MSKNKFQSIARHQLTDVIGGVTRAAGASSTDQTQQLQMMMSQIGDSIKALAANQNNNSSSSMMPMMMMMMMGQGGGGGGALKSLQPRRRRRRRPAGTMVKVNVRRDRHERRCILDTSSPRARHRHRWPRFSQGPPQTDPKLLQAIAQLAETVKQIGQDSRRRVNRMPQGMQQMMQQMMQAKGGGPK